jgi:mRNA-degrading endonuclease RelE of RelBE toxin-antitoxin system
MPPMAEVQLTPEAAEQFDQLPTAIKSRIRDIITRLADWPQVSGAKPLQHELKGACRIRTGGYRILFVIRSPDLVVIIRIDNRRDVYRRR